MNQNIKNLVVVILGLALIIVIAFFLLLPSVSYFGDIKEVEGTITLGEVHFEFVNDVPLFSKIQDFSGGEINEQVEIINARDKLGQNTDKLLDSYIRFRVISPVFVTINIASSDFFADTNGYFYYKGILKVGESLRLINSFVVDGEQIDGTNNKIDVQVIVDTMQASKTLIYDVFENAPLDWVNTL